MYILKTTRPGRNYRGHLLQEMELVENLIERFPKLIRLGKEFTEEIILKELSARDHVTIEKYVEPKPKKKEYEKQVKK